MERWEEIICESTSLEWVAIKMLNKFSEHRQKYPGFDIERAARWFTMHDEKTQKRMCYEDAASINKGARLLDGTFETYVKEHLKANSTEHVIDDFDDGSGRPRF